MVRFASVFALAFGFLSLCIMGCAQDEKKGKAKSKGKGTSAMEAAYKRFDENGDGKVSKEEFKKFTMTAAAKDGKEKALSAKLELLDKIFTAMDANKDGSLSLEEYKGGREKTLELLKGQ